MILVPHFVTEKQSRKSEVKGKSREQRSRETISLKKYKQYCICGQQLSLYHHSQIWREMSTEKTHWTLDAHTEQQTFYTNSDLQWTMYLPCDITFLYTSIYSLSKNVCFCPEAK